MVKDPDVPLTPEKSIRELHESGSETAVPSSGKERTSELVAAARPIIGTKVGSRSSNGRIAEIVIGAVAVIVSAVLGAILTAKYTHKFQAELLEKQLQAQKELLTQQLKFQEELENKLEARRQAFERVQDSQQRAMQQHR